jgi:hypothetical protein
MLARVAVVKNEPVVVSYDATFLQVPLFQRIARIGDVPLAASIFRLWPREPDSGLR